MWISVIMLLALIVNGCSSSPTPTYDPSKLDLPPVVEVKLTTIPAEPIAGEPTIIRVAVMDERKPRDGMRIELRNNARETRLHEAEEKVVSGQTVYEIQAVLEQSGENIITYHFNVDHYHLMSSFTIEVKEDGGR